MIPLHQTPESEMERETSDEELSFLQNRHYLAVVIGIRLTLEARLNHKMMLRQIQKNMVLCMINI